MNDPSPFSPVSVTTRVLTATAIAIAVILLGSNFTVISAQQQQLTTGTGGIESTAETAATLFQSTSDSFSIQVPNGWIVDDRNNTGFELSEEIRRGYGLLAQLCPEQEQGAQALSAGAASAANSTTSNNTCQGAQEEIVHVIRYPDLNMRIQPTSNLTQLHLGELQEVGYSNIQITNTTDVTVNLTNPLTNETIQTVPATFADVTYTTAASNEMRTGHYILTSTNNTAPNATATKGYAVFYEGNSGGTNNTLGTAAITPTTSIISPLSPQVAQILDSFELIVTPEAAETLAQQAAEPAEFTEDTTDDEVEEEEEDEGDDNGGDDNGGDDDVPNPDDCIIIGGDGDIFDDCDFTSDEEDEDNGGGDIDG